MTETEFERELIREGTPAELASVQACGWVEGRHQGLSEKAEHLAIMAETLYCERKLGVKEIAQLLRIPKATICQYKNLFHSSFFIHSCRGQINRANSLTCHILRFLRGSLTTPCPRS